MLSSAIRSLVNSNDNYVLSWLGRGDRLENQRYAVHFPLASSFIASAHCKEWWKNHPESYEYQYAHSAICCQLYYPCTIREYTLRRIAIFLRCNPVTLMNDAAIALTGIH